MSASALNLLYNMCTRSFTVRIYLPDTPGHISSDVPGIIWCFQSFSIIRSCRYSSSGWLNRSLCPGGILSTLTWFSSLGPLPPWGSLCLPVLLQMTLRLLLAPSMPSKLMSLRCFLSHIHIACLLRCHFLWHFPFFFPKTLYHSERCLRSWYKLAAFPYQVLALTLNDLHNTSVWAVSLLLNPNYRKGLLFSTSYFTSLSTAVFILAFKKVKAQPCVMSKTRHGTKQCTNAVRYTSEIDM